MSAASRLFIALVFAQAAHSIEEYLGRLYDVFPPARFLTSLVSADREIGFLVINAGLFLFGLWCLAWPVRRQWTSARPIMWGWALVETSNGIVHPAWSVMQGGYTPGAITAPVLLVVSVLLIRELLRTRRLPLTPLTR